MKKVNIIAIIAIILVALITVAALLFVFNDKEEKDDGSGLLKCTTKAAVEKYIEENEVPNYSIKDSYATIPSISIFNAAAAAEITFTGETVSQIKIDYTVFQDKFENMSEEELENFDIMQYQFSQENKEQIEKAFNSIKEGFEKYIAGTLDQFDLVPTHTDIPNEGEDALFYKGLIIKECSVRDRKGMLWLLRYEASYGRAHATLIKVVDESAYEGFIPTVDLTKP